jgi:hypothetical protein
VLGEPFCRQVGHTFKRAVFFKQVSCPWNDPEFFNAIKLREGFSVELDHYVIGTAYDQQRWCFNASQAFASQIGTPTARYNGAYRIRKLRGCYQSCCGPGAGAEVANPQTTNVRLRAYPASGVDQASGKQIYIEPQVPRQPFFLLFPLCQKIEEQSPNARFTD